MHIVLGGPGATWGDVLIYQFDHVFPIFFINSGSANADNKIRGRQNRLPRKSTFPRTIPIPEMSHSLGVVCTTKAYL